MNETKSSDKEQTGLSDLINISWQAFEFEKHEKGMGWFVIVGAIALFIFTISLLMKNLIFGIMIIISVFTIFIYALKEPKLVNFKIDGIGLTIGEKLFPYSEINSFWIFYDPPVFKELSVKLKRWTSPLLKIQMEEQDPLKIRTALLNFIPEEEQQQSLIDIISKYLKF